jgi:nitronate monooxygenase
MDPCALHSKIFLHKKIAENILATYFIDGGRSKDQSYKRSPMFSLSSPLSLLQLTVASSFVEVWLAKQGHHGKIGMNLLEKIHLPNLACLYGAMLADVDYIVMGAGIPREIPGALDLLSQHQKAHIKLPVVGSQQDIFISFDPREVMEDISSADLKRPYFFPDCFIGNTCFESEEKNPRDKSMDSSWRDL